VVQASSLPKTRGSPVPPLPVNAEKISEVVERPDRFMHVIPAKARIQRFRWIVDPGFRRGDDTFLLPALETRQQRRLAAENADFFL
jgi:hypothetical protein